MRHRIRFAAVLAAFAFLIARAPDRAGAQDLPTPDDVVRLFASAVARNDLEGALAACAINEAANGYDFSLSVKRMGAVTPFVMPPSEYRMYAEINKRYQASAMALQIRFFIYSLLAAELAEGRVVKVDSDAEIERYRRALDPAKIAGLELVDVGTPMPGVSLSPRNLDNFRLIAKCYGADDAVERVALYRWNGGYYYGGFQLLRYGKSWKVSSLVSTLGNTPAIGAVQPTTVEEFNRLTSR